MTFAMLSHVRWGGDCLTITVAGFSSVLDMGVCSCTLMTFSVDTRRIQRVVTEILILLSTHKNTNDLRHVIARWGDCLTIIVAGFSSVLDMGVCSCILMTFSVDTRGIQRVLTEILILLSAHRNTNDLRHVSAR
jgi:predicted nucleic acid-binding Zn finger protein